MLTSTFVLLKGVGPGTEQRFWQDGIGDWSEFLKRPAVSGISPARKAWYDRDLTEAMSHLERGRTDFFATALKRHDHWRLFETFRHRTLYLDIETTGLPHASGHVTIVGLYRNGRMSSLVHGDSLTEDRLQEELAQTDLLVTFFGSGFDIPYLQATFPRLDFRKPHFDLCPAARRLGLRGGLKHVEREAQIHRDHDLAGLDGWDAVRLWEQWRGGSESALSLLLKYNAADTQNLEPLAHLIFEGLAARYGPRSVTGTGGRGPKNRSEDS
ncbi:MAG: ribonuclease H-like domain-containing protein [Nitrospira sp.]|nr:ribonuclease H-like domain-containing protein [Nitrospira sp.]